MNSPELKTLERSSYYAVVRALFACGRLQTFENELLLTDLQEALNISEQERLAYLQQVEQDTEAADLATFADTDDVQAGAASAGAAADAYMPVHVLEHTRQSAVPALPQIPYLPHASTSGPGNKGKGKKTASAAGGNWKQSNSKKSKSAGNTPLTPRSQQNKGSFKSSDKRNAAQKAVDKAQLELDRLNAREREIFETLLEMGVEDEDPELNEVQRSLLKWYRMDGRQREIENELYS